MNFIFVGSLHIQHRTPACRQDIYADSVMDKLNQLIKLSIEHQARLVFAPGWVDPRLDKSMMPPIMKMLVQAPFTPIVALSPAAQIETAELPHSHALSIFEACGLVEVLYPNGFSNIASDQQPVWCSSGIPEQGDSSTGHYVILSQHPVALPREFDLKLAWHHQALTKASVDGWQAMPTIGRISPAMDSSRPEVLLFNAMSAETTWLPVHYAQENPFLADEVERAQQASSDIASGSLFANMLMKQRAESEAEQVATEAILKEVIDSIEASGDVSKEAIDIVMDLWHGADDEGDEAA